MEFEGPIEEVRNLQRCMSDLVSVLALPAVWSGQEPRQILTTFHDALMATLNLDFLYTRARTETSGEPIEILKTAPLYAATHNADKIRQTLNKWFGADPERWPTEIRSQLGGQETSLIPVRLGIEGEIGIVIAGSGRADFPSQTERLILGVAANQAAVGLQQARLLSEQKRIAGELDRRVAERTRELAETNQNLQLQVGILQHLPVSAWTLKPDGTPDFVNRVWLEFSGQTLDFVRSHPEAWMTAVHPEDREKAARVFWEGVRSGQGFSFETRSLRARDGTYRWHLQQAVVLHDAEGKVLKFVGTTTDIHDQKLAEEALRAGEANLRRVIDTIPTLSWCNLPDGSNEFLSKSWHDYTGLSPEEAHGWGWRVTFHPEDLPALMEKWQGMLISGEPGEIEARIRRNDGVYRWFLIRAQPFRDDDGNILRWYGSSTDIHDRKLAEEALRAGEANLRRMIDNMPGLVSTLGPDGETKLINRQILEYFGKTFEELRNWRLSDAIHPDDLPRIIALHNQSIRPGVSFGSEYRLRRSDGVYRWFQFRAEVVHDAADRVSGWYVLATDIHDRKRVEDELKKSEAGYRVVVETANDAVIGINESGTIILANPATRKVFGHEPADLIGKPLTVLMPEAMRGLHEAGYRRYLATGQKHMNWQGVELSAQRANGEVFPVEVSFGEMVSGDRRIFTGFVRDISEKKRAEEAIRSSERNLSLTINTMPALAWSARPDGSAEFLSQRWLNYTGMSAPEAEGWGWVKAMHPDDLDPLIAYWQSALSSGEPGEIEARIRSFDGSYRWFLFRANPLRDESGAIVKWYGTNTDIDDRKRAEEQLRRSEAFLTEGQRLSRTGTFCWRLKTNEIIWSEELFHIFGLDPEMTVTLELIGSRIHPEDMAVMGDMTATAQRGDNEFEYEHRIVMPDGSIRHIHLIGHAVRDAAGQLEYFGAAQDVTQRRLAEEAVARSRAELANVMRAASLGALTASIAHEVNQPLSGIITNANTCLRMLSSSPPNIDGALETARRTIRDGNRASDVVTHLRALFKRKEIAAEPIDLNDAAREVIALSLSELQSNRIQVLSDLDENLPAVKGDRIQLQQVILNLLRNASDAMRGVDERPRQLLIKTDNDGGRNVQLSVQDTGIGFAPEAADRLFDSFYTTKDDGMGIGLSVSRSIIEAHGGRLWATANDGPGSSFSFSIPYDHSA